MTGELIDASLALPESLFPEFGSQNFYLVFGSCVLAWLLVARLFMGMLKSRRGIVAAAIALLVPTVVGLIGYGLSILHLVPMLDEAWAEQLLPPGIFGLLLILTAFITSKRILGLDGSSGIVVFLFATAGAIGAYFCAEITLKTLDQGGQQIKMREEKKERAMDSLF
jgi:hypothetical protein